MELLAQGIDPSQTDWIAVTRDLGFPIAIALVLLFFMLSTAGGIGAVMWRIGNWFAPIVERVATKHIDLMGTLETSTIKRDEIDRRTADTLEVLTESHQAANKSMEDTRMRTTLAIEELASTQKKSIESLVKIQEEITFQRGLQERLIARLESSPSVGIGISANSVEVREAGQ